MNEADKGDDLEARLAALKHRLERGLIDRARTLRDMASRLERGEQEARRAIKTESHKLRGVAGTYGHHDLTELAAKLEQRASMSPTATVATLARELADLAERKGHDSKPPPPGPQRASKPPSASAGEPTRALRPSQPAPARPLRVLAMDDDTVTQRLLELTLRHVGGFDATIVASAAEALELLARERYDVVLSDAMMPDMNGRQFRKAAREAGASMPIVILSAASPDELGWQAEAGDRGAWLRKPFKPSELVRELERIVAAYREASG